MKCSEMVSLAHLASCQQQGLLHVEMQRCLTMLADLQCLAIADKGQRRQLQNSYATHATICTNLATVTRSNSDLKRVV